MRARAIRHVGVGGWCSTVVSASSPSSAATPPDRAADVGAAEEVDRDVFKAAVASSKEEEATKSEEDQSSKEEEEAAKEEEEPVLWAVKNCQLPVHVRVFRTVRGLADGCGGHVKWGAEVTSRRVSDRLRG